MVGSMQTRTNALVVEPAMDVVTEVFSVWHFIGFPNASTKDHVYTNIVELSASINSRLRFCVNARIVSVVPVHLEYFMRALCQTCQK